MDNKVSHRKSSQTTTDKAKPQENSKHQETSDDSKVKKPRYGPLPYFRQQRLWSKSIMLIGVLLVVWYNNRNPRELKLATQKQTHKNRGQSFDCDRDYLEEISDFKGCEPKRCGRYVMDTLITHIEADLLLGIAQRGMKLGGSTGGATILDLHSGALSYGEKFINLYSTEKAKEIISAKDLTVYKIVRSKIQQAIASNFEISEHNLHLTHPTFFSRLSNKDPQTEHDEYWHEHVDKETYEAFHYTSLLYLSDYGIDFKGGRFVFLADSDLARNNVTVEPRKGRVLMFTSGRENPHLVERVTAGERYAITISFTCNKTKAVGDPKINK